MSRGYKIIHEILVRSEGHTSQLIQLAMDTEKKLQKQKQIKQQQIQRPRNLLAQI